MPQLVLVDVAETTLNSVQKHFTNLVPFILCRKLSLSRLLLGDMVDSHWHAEPLTKGSAIDHQVVICTAYGELVVQKNLLSISDKSQGGAARMMSRPIKHLAALPAKLSGRYPVPKLSGKLVKVQAFSKYRGKAAAANRKYCNNYIPASYEVYSLP